MAFQPAPHGRRFLAHLIDLIALAMLSGGALVVWAAFGGVEPGPVQQGTSLTADLRLPSPGLADGLGMLLASLYFVLFWRLVGTSPGKRLMGLRVLAPDGRSPDLKHSILRYLTMSFFGSLLGATWWSVFLRQDRRAIHDLLAGTQVVLVQ